MDILKDEDELEGTDGPVHSQDETLSDETPSSCHTFEPLKKFVMSVWECFTCITCLGLSIPIQPTFSVILHVLALPTVLDLPKLKPP